VKPVTLHRKALEEFDAAAAYYAAIDPALGRRFYAVIDRLIAEACASPDTFRFIRKPARRHFSREFPYGIIYLDRSEDLWIVAIMHLRRKPGYWQQRLS
jgi:plasmid stabilization system protein ParE